MTTQQDELQETTPEKDERAGSGEPIHLHREWGDQWLDGWLGWDVHIPADAPPAVRKAAEHAVSVQAKRDKWILARDVDRPAARVPLAKKVAELMGTTGPELVKARRELTDHDTDSNIIATDVIPQADQAVVDSWYALSAALRASWGEKDGYIYARVPEVAETALRHAEAFLQAAHELQSLEDLLVGVGIVRKVITTGAEQHANFEREERRGILHSYAGLADLVQKYVTTMQPQPPPEPEPEPEPVPIPLQNQRRRVGLDPLTGKPVDPFMVSS